MPVRCCGAFRRAWEGAEMAGSAEGGCGDWQRDDSRRGRLALLGSAAEFVAALWDTMRVI